MIISMRSIHSGQDFVYIVSQNSQADLKKLKAADKKKEYIFTIFPEDQLKHVIEFLKMK